MNNNTPPISVTRQKIIPGAKQYIQSKSPLFPYTLVFEDDSRTGLLYAVEMCKQKPSIIDAVRLYSCIPSQKILSYEIYFLWTLDGFKAACVIDSKYSMIFDFKSKYGFISPNTMGCFSQWTKHQSAWQAEAIVGFSDFLP